MARRTLDLTRAERIRLATAALRGVLSGAAAATITWFLDHVLPMV